MSLVQEQEQSFLMEMDGSADDMELRHIFVDWLLEQDDPRAELTRALTLFYQEEIDELDTSDPELLMQCCRFMAPPRTELNALNDFQQRMMPIWREMWMQVGHCIVPANRPEAEKGIYQLYQMAELPEPLELIWCPSPRSGILAASEQYEKESPTMRGMAWEALRDKIWIPIQSFVRERVAEPLLMDIEGTVEQPVLDRVWLGCGTAVRGNLPLEGGTDFPNDLLYRCHVGSQDAEWGALYSFLQYVCGLQLPRDLMPDLRLTLNAGWCWPCMNCAILSERPDCIHIDPKTTSVHLHYSDGYEAEGNYYE